MCILKRLEDNKMQLIMDIRFLGSKRNGIKSLCKGNLIFVQLGTYV